MIKKIIKLVLGKDLYELCRSVKHGSRCYLCDPITAAIIGTVIVGAGLYEGISALTSHPKAPDKAAPTAAVPSTDTAATRADQLLTQHRRTLLASGGTTSLTGSGGSPLLGGSVNAPLLGGS